MLQPSFRQLSMFNSDNDNKTCRNFPQYEKIKELVANPLDKPLI